MEGTINGWDAIESEVERLTHASVEPFHFNVLANLRDLLQLCRSRSALPTGIAKGYWATIRIWWPHFELEVFEDRIEVYRFGEDGTAIWHEDHRPGHEFSDHFLEELATALRLNSVLSPKYFGS